MEEEGFVEGTMTPGEALIDWVTHDMGETEATMQEFFEFLSRIDQQRISSVEELYALWESLTETWNGEEV